MTNAPHPREGPRPATPSEARAVFHAERDGLPFLVHRDLGGAQQLLRLPPERATLAIGRNAAADLCLSWDEARRSLRGGHPRRHHAPVGFAEIRAASAPRRRRRCRSHPS